MSAALKVSGLDKELGEQKTLVLKNISFEVEQGEFVSLVGKSGSGKSTLLYILSTLDWPTRGTVEFAEALKPNNPTAQATYQNVQKMAPVNLHRLRNQNIGFVFQFHYLLAELSALENVLMPARKAGQMEEKREFAKQVLESVGLGDRMNHLPRELSGGQAQRVAIARSLVMNPTFLFADEPTGSLDSQNSQTVFEIFQRINRDLNTTIVMVTHDPDLAAATSRQIELMDGQIIGDRRS